MRLGTRLLMIVAAGTLSSVGLVGLSTTAASADACATPGQTCATISPAPIVNGANQNTYVAGTTVSITVPPNTEFATQGGQTVAILMCADEGGLTANLPTDATNCDGLTLNTDNGSFFVHTDGSFSTQDPYVIYKLPDTASLKENPNQLPKCDATDACVLFIGVDQTNFSLPHVFSPPFYVVSATQGVPESHFALELPLAALAMLAAASGVLVWRRRRHQELVA